MTVLLSFFFLSCIEQFAQHYLLSIHDLESERLRKLLPAEIRSQLFSPMTGRLRLNREQVRCMSSKLRANDIKKLKFNDIKLLSENTQTDS